MICACGCGTPVGPDSRGRPRRFVHGHNTRGRRLDEDHRAKISRSHRGVPLSIEHRGALCGPRPQARGESNHAWRGDEATYEAIHQWLDREFGHEKTSCEECGAGSTDRRLEWAFLGNNGAARRDRIQYRVLCTPCHRTADNAKGYVW